MRKSLKKGANMASKFYAKSLENHLQKRDAKMMPTCSKLGAQNGRKIYKQSVNIEVQETTEKT